MNVDRIVFLGCLIAMVTLTFHDVTSGNPINAAGPDVVASGMPVNPGNSLTAPAAPITQLVALMDGRCILWYDVDERHMMTCGDTLPAVKVVNLERRYFQ